MSRPAVLATFLALIPVAASADAALTISFDVEDVTTIRYDCGEDVTLEVVYVATETDSLALVPVDGDPRVFAGVVTGSGARYVAGQYEWATNNETGLLTDTLEGETVLDCATADR